MRSIDTECDLDRHSSQAGHDLAAVPSSRMQLGCIFPAIAAPNAQYRAVFPMSALQHRKHEIVWCGPVEDKIPVDRLRHCDLVHVYRTAEPAVVELMEELREGGVAVTWDNDDDVTRTPKEAPHYRIVGGLRGARDFAFQKRAMRQADLVTTTSHALAEKFRHSGAANVTVIENYLPWEFLRVTRLRHDGLVIGWLAGGEHAVDAKRLNLRAVLRDVLRAHPGVRVATVGLDIQLGHERYERWRKVPLAGVANVVRGFDIGLAPLADIPFNHCRSTIKVKEYAAAGVPWLASPVGEYAVLGPREGGRLIPDDQWREAIDRLIRRRLERYILARRARRWAATQTSDRNVGEWERAFAEAIARARARQAGRLSGKPAYPSATANQLGARPASRDAR